MSQLGWVGFVFVGVGFLLSENVIPFSRDYDLIARP